MPTPVDIAHSPSEDRFTIEWEDGLTTTYDGAYLRGWCPCAACQGHGATSVFRAPKPGVKVERAWEVGAYALGLRFSDGHDTGVYTWAFLRAIAPETPPAGPKRGPIRAKDL
jgi:DUF971 family protein